MRKVLIVGDSQSQGIGRVLQKLLTAKGDDVTRLSLPGRSTDKILKEVKARIDPKKYGAVYIFAGGNDYKAMPATAKELVSFFLPAKVVWIGPPPATVIGNLTLAKKVFGSKVKDKNFWISSGVTERRNAKNQVYRKTISQTPARYVDPRDAMHPFPQQPDGIHVVGVGAQVLAKKIAAPPPKFPLFAVSLGLFIFRRFFK